MKKVFLPFFCLFFAASVADAQTVTWSTPGCGTSNPNLQMVVFQGCTPSEGTKEFVHFTTGTTPWNVSDLTITGSQNPTFSPFSPCVSTGFSGNLTAAAALNSIAGCSPPLFDFAPATIPPNAKVLVIPNVAGAFAVPPYQNDITAAQLAPLCGKGPIYVVGNTPNPGCTNGIFANINPACPSNCNRNIIINFGGGCTATINYDINDPAMPSPTAEGVNFTPNNNGTASVNVPNTCFPIPCEIPDATVSVNAGAKLCANSAQSMSINLTTNAPVGSTFKWSGPTGSIFFPSSTVSNPAVTIASPGLPVGINTYSVTITVPGGCSKSASINILINQGTSISTNITGSNTICPNSSAVLSASGNFSSYKWNTGETSASINISSGGLYSVTVENGSGCNATASKSVSILNTPNPIISGVTSICQGASITLAVNGTYNTYLWSNGSTSPYTMVNTAGQYNVTVTDSNGCKGVASVNVTSSGTLNLAITGNTNFCAGESTTLSAGAGFSSYHWDSGETTSSITTAISGVHSVTVSNGLCTGTASIVVNQVAHPIVNIVGNSSICKGSTTTLAVNGGNSYVWSNGANTNIVTVSNGIHTVTVTNANGCTGISSIAVSEYPPLTPVIIGPSTLCGIVGNVTLTLNQPFTTYAWSNSSNISITTINSAGTYSVTVTDSNGCTAVASTTITQSGSLSPKFNNNTNVICGNSSISLALNEPYSSYQWSTSATSATLVATTSGTYAVTVTNGSGCTGIAATNVQQFPAFSVMIAGSDKICSGKTASLAANTSGSLYQWSNGEKTQTIQVATPGAYTLTATDINGCTAVASKTLTLAANALTNYNVTICKGEKFNFNKQVLTQSGTYTGVFTALNTCDSTVVLKLNVLPVDTVRLQKTLCSGVAGTFVDVLKQQNGCDSVIILTVKIATKLNVVISEQNKVLTLNTTLSGVTYQWLLNGKAIIGANSAAFTAFVDGLYCVEITDVNGCTHKSNTIQIGEVATNDIAQSNIRIYPNPTTGWCRIEGDDDFVKNALLVNLLGQKYSLQIIDNQMDISIFPNGMYQLLLQNKEGKAFCAKLIKQ
jgi:hypothetical protein